MMSFFLFCYFCLKAGADRSRVWWGMQNKQFYSTVLGFHHITKLREADKKLLCWEREIERERTTQKVFIYLFVSEPAAQGQNWSHMIPFWLCTLIWMSHNTESVEMWWIRGLSYQRQWQEGVITKIGARSMRRESVRWELTVEASGGQPQVYTSLFS